MKRHIRNQQQRKEEAQAIHQEETKQVQHEFATADEMIRHDAAQTPPPQSLADRLQESIDTTQPPPANSPWWRKFLGFGS